MTTQETHTESRTDPADVDAPVSVDIPGLRVVMECRRPGVPGLRVVLDGASDVVFGRGTGTARGTKRHGRTVELTLPDQA
jgi:hypothetical protein